MRLQINAARATVGRIPLHVRGTVPCRDKRLWALPLRNALPPIQNSIKTPYICHTARRRAVLQPCQANQETTVDHSLSRKEPPLAWRTTAP